MKKTTPARLEAPARRAAPEPLWTVEDTAAYFGITTGGLRNMLGQDRFPISPVRIGRAVRFRGDDIRGYVDNQLASA